MPPALKLQFPAGALADPPALLKAGVRFEDYSLVLHSPEHKLLRTPELDGAVGLDVNSPNSHVRLFCVNCVSLSLTEGFFFLSFFYDRLF